MKCSNALDGGRMGLLDCPREAKDDDPDGLCGPCRGARKRAETMADRRAAKRAAEKASEDERIRRARAIIARFDALGWNSGMEFRDRSFGYTGSVVLSAETAERVLAALGG